ncbi:MAG: hypothetical protein VW498_01335 [Candidatus Thalassarchaeaceae archaeon]
MAIDYSRYRPDLSSLGIGTGRYGARTPQYNRQINRIRRYFKTPRNYQKNAAGLGYVLPKIGGLRLRDINTAQGRRTAITGGPGNFIYGFTDRNKFKIGKVGDGLGLVRRGGKGGGGAATPPKPSTPAAPPDPYAKYDKDYKWIGDYLRGLRDQEQAFGDIFKNEFQPSVTAALTSMGNLATGAADRYARAAAAGAAANQAAANLAPVQAAGSTEAFDPIGLAAEQAASRATGAAAAENARMGATMSALAPVTAGQGILANIQRGYTAISAEYANKRIEDQMKLEQWIAEQESAAKDREIQQQYNLGLLGVQQGRIDADIASDEADRREKGDIRTLERDGWIRLPKGAGTRGLNTTTANDGTVMYKPRDRGTGSSGGSDGLTANQTQQLGSRLYDAYTGTSRDAVGNAIGQGPGFRDLPVQEQVRKIETWVRQEVSRGNIPNNRAAIANFISAAIPILQTKQGGAYSNAPQGNTTTWGQRIAANIAGG